MLAFFKIKKFKHKIKVLIFFLKSDFMTSKVPKLLLRILDMTLLVSVYISNTVNRELVSLFPT